MPIKLSGRTDAIARSVIGIVEVFDPNIAVWSINCSAFFVISAFSSEFSKTASTTKSTPVSLE